MSLGRWVDVLPRITVRADENDTVHVSGPRWFRSDADLLLTLRIRVVLLALRRWLDMEVSGDLVAVSVPLGIYDTMEAYCSALQEAGRDQHPTELKYFGVKCDAARPFVSVTWASVLRALEGRAASEITPCTVWWRTRPIVAGISRGWGIEAALLRVCMCPDLWVDGFVCTERGRGEGEAL